MVEPERTREQSVEINAAADSPPDADEAERLLSEANDAVISMVERERRRDGTYDTAGDDHDPGIDLEIDSNAPKELQKPPKKRGAS